VTFNVWTLGTVGRLAPAVLAVAAVDLMESIALGRAMARKNGYRINASECTR
jgi:MFS superfamily sulfate permease-like transporter